MKPLKEKSLGYQITTIGPIPEDWDVVRLEEVGKIFTGKTPSTKVPEFWNGEVMFVTPTDFMGKKYIDETSRYVTRTGAKQGTLIPPNSVMVVCIASLGEVAINTRECITNQQINTIIPSNKAYYEYLYYILRFRADILKLWAGTTTTPIIKKSSFERFPIPLPPLPEQKRIAEVLRTVDEAIEKVEQEIEHTERLKKGLMQHLLTRGIGHTRFKDSPLGKIPESWKVVKLREVGSVVTGKTPSTKVREFWNGEIMFVTPTDYKGRKYINNTERYITKKGTTQSVMIPPKSVLVVCIGSVGEVAINSDYCITNQQINSIIPGNKVDTEYLYYALKFKSRILRLWAGTTTKPIIKKSLFENFPIPLPPFPEQNKIAEILMTVDRKIELLKNKKEHLERLKKGLMNDLLTGRRRMKVVSKV